MTETPLQSTPESDKYLALLKITIDLEHRNNDMIRTSTLLADECKRLKQEIISLEHQLTKAIDSEYIKHLKVQHSQEQEYQQAILNLMSTQISELQALNDTIRRK